MANVQESIDVDVPVSTAYNQWTQFETFPESMKGVEAGQWRSSVARGEVDDAAGDPDNRQPR